MMVAPDRTPGGRFRFLVRTGTALLLTALVSGVAAAGGGETADLAESVTGRPIIVEVLADPAKFADRKIVIYGVVIDVRENGSWFTLQDVSHRQLDVVNRRGQPVVLWDQLLILGTVRTRREAPYLEAERTLKTKVVGGGCC